jgi:GT2 family glycosyltransferase
MRTVPGNRGLSPFGTAYPLRVPDAPDVTVSIVSSGDVGLLRACLDSIPAAAEASAVETIVVDNAVGIAAAVAGSHPDVTVIAGGLRRGFGANHNLIAREARGRLIFILNDDTVLDPACIDRLRSFMDRNGAVAAAGPRLRHADGRPQPSAFHFPTPGRVALTTLTLQRAGWIMSGGERIRRVDWIHGAAMMVRRDALEGVGGLDEGFYMYLEDVDLCRRLRDRGWEIAFFPRAGLVHLENSSTAAVPMRRVYQHARSRGIYARKHHGPGGEKAVQRLTAATFLARATLARVLPGYGADAAARFRAHAQAALDPYAEPAIEEAAEEHNRGVTA